MILPWRSAATIALVSIILLVIVRLRPPIDWVATQFVFTYDLGFQRRALLGEMLSWVYPDGLTWAQANAVAAALTLVSTLALIAFVWRGCRAAGDGSGGLWLVLFASSLGLGSWIGNSGYLEACGLIVTLLALSLNTRKPDRLALACALMVVAVLFHEIALPCFVPLVALDVWLRNADRRQATRLAMAALPVLVGVTATIVAVRFGTHPADLLEDLYRLAQARSLDYPMWPTAVDATAELPPGAIDPFREAWSIGFNAVWLGIFILFGLVVVIPTTALVLAAARHLPALERMGIAAAICAPLTLLLVAFDVSRFLAVAMLNAYVIGAILLRRDARFAQNLAHVLTPANVLVLLLLHSHIILQDLNQTPIFKGRAPGALFSQVYWFHANTPEVHIKLQDPSPMP